MYRVQISEIEEADEGWLGPAFSNTGHVATVTVIAYGPREAAARAFARTLGRDRARYLIKLGAPSFFIRAQCDVRRLSRQLEKTADWAGPCYRLSNMVQTWHFHVRRAPLKRAARVRLAAYQAAKSDHHRRLRKGAASPSAN